MIFDEPNKMNGF